MRNLIPRLALCAALTLSVTAIGASKTVKAADDPPSTPAKLEAQAYGPTSGGIRWLRSIDDRGAVKGYEVVRNGVVLGVHDALSHIERDLSPGTVYTFGITAIDSANQRSGTARVRLVTPDARPLMPENLGVNVYSSTALGLHWNRPDVFGVHHQIRRNGRTVASTDGITFVARDLVPGRTYLFEVIAVNRQGQRSPSARLTIATNGSTTVLPSVPPAPSGLRAVAYSATAAGLAWARSADIGTRHEVSRDGVILATSDAVTYVDEGLAAGSNYRYAIVAIDRHGRRSLPASVSLRTPGIAPLVDQPSDASTLNHDNALAVVSRVLSVYAGKGYDEAIGRAHYIDTSDAPYSVEIVDAALDITKSVFACDNGGTATLTAASYTESAFSSELYENCEWNGRVHDGEVNFNSQPYGVFNWEYDRMAVEDFDGGRLSVEGSVTRSYRVCKIDKFDRWQAENVHYESTTTDGFTQLENVNTVFGYGNECQQLTSRLEGSFTLRSPLVEGRLLHVDTPVDFVNPDSDSRRFLTGRLVIRAEDGSVLALDTDDGDSDAETVALVLMFDGESETQSHRWETWEEILSFDDDG